MPLARARWALSFFNPMVAGELSQVSRENMNVIVPIETTFTYDVVQQPQQLFEPFPMIPGGLLHELELPEQSIVYRVLLETELPPVVNPDDDFAPMLLLNTLTQAFEGNKFVLETMRRQWSDTWNLAVYGADFRRGYERRAKQ